MTTTQSDRVFLARTAEAQGYWGKHPDGVHHAIATCCDEGANRFGLFVVYQGDDSMTCDPVWGQVQWNADQDEPILEGIYTAAGCRLGDSLAEVAEDLRKGYLEPAEHALDNNTIQALRDHKPQ